MSLLFKVKTIKGVKTIFVILNIKDYLYMDKQITYIILYINVNAHKKNIINECKSLNELIINNLCLSIHVL